MASDDRRSVELSPDQLEAVDELARHYTNGDYEALVRLAIHRLLASYLEEEDIRLAREHPLWEGREPPVFGDEEPDRGQGEPMVVSMRELVRLREIFGRYPEGPIVLQDDDDEQTDST